MNRYKRYLPIAALVLIGLGVNLDQFGIDLNRLAGNEPVATSDTAAGDATTSGWSDTDPNINLAHIFHGEINRSGQPTGFHSRPDGQDPADARLKRLRQQPNSLGVYTAQIEIRDGDRWREKFSSMFPDSLSVSQVVDAVLHAFRNADNPRAQPWEGPSGLGFRIQGYTSSRGGINTAFPVFVRKP